MSYGTSLYDKINFFYIAANFNSLGGIRMVSKNFEKMFLTFLGLGTNVVKPCRSLVFSGTVHWFVGRLAFIHYCGLHQV